MLDLSCLCNPQVPCYLIVGPIDPFAMRMPLWKVLKSATNFMDMIVADGLPTIIQSKEALQSAIKESLPPIAKLKTLVIEILLVRQLSKINSADIPKTDDGKGDKHPLVAEMEALVMSQSIFLNSNLLEVTAADIQPSLWLMAQCYAK